jgi:Caspase domain
VEPIELRYREPAGRPGYMKRAWQAIISVSASGPEYSSNLEEGGYTLRPRMAADLRYTTADVEFFASFWREPHYDAGDEEFHLPHLRNPSRSAVVGAFLQAGEWLGSRASRPDWDGGHMAFNFAGHGREGDGALAVDDGYITPEDVYRFFVETAERWSSNRRLRLVVVLDSCHSGAFLRALLELVLAERRLRIEYFGAACMPDEMAWEESGLGHGIFTYSWSVRPAPDQPPFGGLTAVGIQADNSFGPSLDIARGPFGCSLLTYGRQNPIFVQDEALTVCGIEIPIYQDRSDDLPRASAEVWSEAFEVRDRFRASLAAFHPNIEVTKYTLSDAEIREYIRQSTRSPRRSAA